MVDFDVGLAFDGGKGLTQVRQLGDAIAHAGAESDKLGDRLAQAFGEGTAAAIREMQAVRQHTQILADDVRQRREEAAAIRQAVDAQRAAKAAADEATRARQAQMRLGEQMADEIDRERRMLLLHAQALEENARRHATVGSSAHGAAAGLGNLRQELVTATRNTLSLNPVVAQLGGLLGHMSLGDPVLIGILGGIAAIGFAYDKLTEKAKKAKEEHDKLRQTLEDFAKKQQLGITGETGAAVSGARAEMLKIQAQIADLEKQKAAAGGGLFAAGGINPRIAKLRDDYQHLVEIVKYGEDEMARLVTEHVKKTADETEHQRAEERAAIEEQRRFRMEDLQAGIENADKIIGTLKQTIVAYNKLEEAAYKAGIATQDIWLHMAKPTAAPLPDLTPNVYGEHLFELPSNAEQVRRTTQEIQAQARVIDQAVQGALQLADAFGIVSRTVRDIAGGLTQALTGIGPLRDAVSNLGKPKEGGGTGALDVVGAALPVIGGFAQAVSSLVGAIQAQRDAAKQMQAAAEQFAASVARWAAENSGNKTAAAILDVGDRRRAAYGAQGLTEADANRIRGADLSSITNSMLRSVVERQKELIANIDALYAGSIERLKTEVFDDLAHRFNALQGPTGAYANALLDAEKAYQQDLQAVETLNLGEDALAKVRVIHAQTLEDLKRAEDHRIAGINEGLAIREAAASGDAKYADELRRKQQEEQEIFAAQQAGWSQEQIDRLRYVQGLEDVADAERKAAEAAQRNADAQAGYTERYLRATGQDDALFEFQQATERAKAYIDLAKGVIDRATFDWLVIAQGAEKAARENEKAAAEAQKVAEAQRQALQLQAQAAQEQIRAAEQVLSVTRQAIDSAKQYLAKSLLGGTSPLGPEARYDEARRQYLALQGAAAGGDVKAYQQLPDAIEAFRKESEAMFGHTSRFRDDFNATQIALSALTDQFGAQASVQEQMLAQMKAQYDYLQQRLAATAIPKEITDNIPKPPTPKDIGEGIWTTQPVRQPGIGDNPGIGPRLPRVPVQHTLDDLYDRLNVLGDHLYNMRQQNTSLGEYTARMHGVLTSELPRQTGYQEATANNTLATANKIGVRPVGDGNGGL